MQEALTLFDSICNSRWFVKTSIVISVHRIQRMIVDTGFADPFPEQDRSVCGEASTFTIG
jgi:hypothetical protein